MRGICPFISKDKLLEIYTSQTQDKDIARMYGVCPPTVTKLRQKYGIPTHPVTKKQRVQMSLSGKNLSCFQRLEIGDAKRISNRRWVRIEWDDENIERLRILCYDGEHTIKDIGGIFGVSQRTIRRAMREHQIEMDSYAYWGVIRGRILAQRRLVFPQICDLYEQGNSTTAIARMVNHSQRFVSMSLIENGVSLRTQGETTRLQFKNHIRQPRTYPIASEHPAWRGGRMKRGKYFIVYAPEQCALHGSKQKYMQEHIFIWEKYYGRLLPKGWIIHHLNGICTDNRIENLEAMPSHKHCFVIQSMGKRIQELEKQLVQSLLNVKINPISLS